MRQLSLFILVFYFLTFAYADFNQSNCEVNIINSTVMTSESRQHFETPFDQHETNNCYSYAAADMLSYKTGRSISPLALAVLSARENQYEYNSDNAGEISRLLELASRVSVCTNSGYNSRDLSYAQLQRPPTYSCRGAALVSPTILNFDVYRDCPEGRGPRRTLTPEFKASTLADINRSLNNLKPVGFSLYLSQLDVIKPGQERNTYSSPHAVTIIGRKWINNRCEYVIRNSLGPRPCAGTMTDTNRVNCEPIAGFPAGTMSVSENVLKEAFHRAYIITESSGDLVLPEICTSAESSFKAGSVEEAAEAEQSEDEMD